MRVEVRAARPAVQFNLICVGRGFVLQGQRRLGTRGARHQAPGRPLMYSLGKAELLGSFGFLLISVFGVLIPFSGDGVVPAVK